jgi:hypothetical protein
MMFLSLKKRPVKLAEKVPLSVFVHLYPQQRRGEVTGKHTAFEPG